jgi:phosphoglycolate phosphatase-like HAD superfamily hydrolase
MIKKIYLDMDGVLCNFEKRYAELYEKTSDLSKNKQKRLFKENFYKFILQGQFRELEWMPGAEDMLALIKSYPIKVEILTSSGGIHLYDEVREQKEEWLINHDIFYRPNVVPGKKYKCMFASPEHIIIDDTLDVITNFNECGGVGIHHTDAKLTMEILKNLMAE